MKKKLMMLLAGLMVVFALSACGSKSQNDVVKELNGKIGDLSGYKANAKMTLKMGTDSQVYNVEIWHKDPTYYRVNLKNAKKDQSQMILRNDDGVFVLTPALNKSFRFQSDWPQNSSQAYLYESLIKDILDDKGAKFNATSKHYVFETKTRYQNNKMLPLQEIKLNKKDLTPASVKIMDVDRNTLVTVEFTKVKLNASFDKDDFEMQKNMTRAQIGLPAMAEASEKSFTVKYPTAELPGVTFTDETPLDTEDGKRVVLTYDGEKSFTLIQEKSVAMPATASPTYVRGEPVDLGFAVGAMTEKSIKWTHEGVDFTLASNDLTAEEMVMVARSVQGDGIK